MTVSLMTPPTPASRKSTGSGPKPGPGGVMVVQSLTLTDAEHARYTALGAATWLRAAIDSARKPAPPGKQPRSFSEAERTRNYSARVTEAQKAKFKALGSMRWLRLAMSASRAPRKARQGRQEPAESLSGHALDAEVARVLGERPGKDYSASWLYAGPLVDRYRIDLKHVDGGVEASIPAGARRIKAIGSTVPEAAMRALLAFLTR